MLRSNDSVDDSAPFVYTKPFLIMDGVISLVSVYPNFACLYHVFRQLRREAIIRNWLYFSMLFATSLCCTVGHPIYMVAKTVGIPRLFASDDHNYVLCCSSIAIYICATGIVPATLVWLSVEQAFVILYPNTARKRSKRTTNTLCCFYIGSSWLIGFITAFIPLFIRNNTLYGGKCLFENFLTSRLILIYFIYSFYCPLTVILLLSIVINRGLKKLQHANEVSPLLQRILSTAKYRKTSRSVIVLSVFCISTWLPLAIVRTAELFDDHFAERVPGYVINSTVLLWHLSVLFNPLYILYKEYSTGHYRPSSTTISITQSLVW